MKIYLIKKYEKPKDFLYPNKGMKDLLPSHMLFVMSMLKKILEIFCRNDKQLEK